MSRSSTTRNTSRDMPAFSHPPSIPRRKAIKVRRLRLSSLSSSSFLVARRRHSGKLRQGLASCHAALQVGRGHGVAIGGDDEAVGLDEERGLLSVRGLFEEGDDGVVGGTMLPKDGLGCFPVAVGEGWVTASFFFVGSRASFLPLHAPPDLGRRFHSSCPALAYCMRLGLARQEEGHGLASASLCLRLARHSKQARQPPHNLPCVRYKHKRGWAELCVSPALSPATNHCTQHTHAHTHTAEPVPSHKVFRLAFWAMPFRRLCFKPLLPPCLALIAVHHLSLPDPHKCTQRQ